MSETNKKTESVEAAATPAKPKTVRIKKPDPVMYVGPTISGIGIQNRVYTEIPVGAQAAFEKEPELRNLFIPVIEYPSVGRMLREEKGYIYSAYMKALALKGGNKE